MAPVEGGAERLMARQCCAPTLPEQPQLAVEKSSSPADSKSSDAAGGELKRQCNPIESATEVSDDRRIDIAQHKGMTARGEAFHEQPHSRQTHRFTGPQSQGIRPTT